MSRDTRTLEGFFILCGHLITWLCILGIVVSISYCTIKVEEINSKYDVRVE